MRPITAPLHPGDQGTEVANLQEGLALLLTRQAIQTDPGAREELLKALSNEARGQVYKDGTAKTVSIFQEPHHIPPTGGVDAPTADALNASLKDLGAFDAVPNGQKQVVAGQVVQDGSGPFKGTVILFREGGQGSIHLGEDAADPEGRYSIGYDAASGQDGAKLRVAAFAPDGRQRADATIAAPKPFEVVNLVVAVDAPAFSVEGKVASRTRAGVSGLRVQIVDKNAGPDVPLAEVSTADDGSYAATFSYGGPKLKPDLQARVLSGETFLGTSEVRYNAPNAVTLHVVLPDGAAAVLASEHETLTGALSAHFQGRLGDLQETSDRQDITYLANKTGWDARAVALAALSDQFSARTAAAAGAGIDPPLFYALFRAGLPASEDALYQADPTTVRSIWQKAVEQGVIAQSMTQAIPAAAERFQALSAQRLLTGPALAGASTLQEMLTTSRLDATQQTQFAELYAAHRADLPTFWNAVTAAFGQETSGRLQLDGKLGFLTINNAPLMQALHTSAGDGGLTDPLQLARQGYYRPAQWSALLTGTVPVPKEIPGDTPEAQRANYAEYLAAQVRLSYPTAALAHMVGNGSLPLVGAAPGISDQVHDFLTEHQGQFEIGMQPVEQFIAHNQIIVPETTVAQVKSLQRVYQITPSDEAMTGLLKNKLDAAYHVVRYDRETFVQTYGQDLGGVESAAQTYDRSVQIHNAVLNIAIGYITAKNGIPLGAQRLESAAPGLNLDGQIMQPAPQPPGNASEIIAYPTLEELFGSMDFCDCEHCRSILSPAAYLVDLLHFIDQPPGAAGNPQAVVLDRRPDIQYLPLTCENTNTALPYIDVVNETLEYFIANTAQKLSLKDYAGHDTADAASEDLLASPQFAMDAAYTTLRGERFPAPLPFHQPLENLRRYFDKFGAPLPQAMETLRKNDDLERGTDPYGRRDMLMEQIGLSRAEYEILTDAVAVPLWRIYGLPSGTSDDDVINKPILFIGVTALPLSNAKLFCRHVGITYDDIVAILQTRFVNPNADLIPKLERLGVPFSTLKALKDGTVTGAAFDALLPSGAAALDPDEYGGDIGGWVEDDANFARIMGLITLTDPTGNPDPCRFDTLELRFARPPADANDTTTRLGVPQLVRLLRFIRLWKKLGWAIEQIDAAIRALYRADLAPLTTADLDTVTALDIGFMTLLPRLGVIARVMQALNLTPQRDLLPLLACWAEIGTDGPSALYRQMFLNPALLKQDAVFADDGFGNYLQRVQASYTHPQATLEQPIRDAAPGHIGYDGSNKRLSCTGTLSVTMRDALKAVPGVSEAFKAAVDALYTAQRLLTHTEALRSACNLAGDEFELIVTALGLNTRVDVPYTQLQPALDQSILEADPGIAYDSQHTRLSYTGYLSSAVRDALKAVGGVTADFQAAVDALYAANDAALKPLTLSGISAIYRRGWLARKLKLSVREVLLLMQLTGLDPFTLPDPTQPAILRLIALVHALKERSLTSAAALYLIWNQDLSGRSAPDPAQVAELARTLRGDFAAVDDQFAVTEDPGGDIARARVALVYGQGAADTFFALLDDTLALDTAYTHSGPTLEAAITTADPQITYDAFRHRLSRTGLLSKATRDALKRAAGALPAFGDAVDALFARGEDVKGSFFGLHPELQPLYNTYVVSAGPVDKKRTVLLAALQPELARRRKRQQALQRLSATAGADPSMTRAILDAPAAPYPLHAAGHPDQPALDDVMALGRAGLAAQFFFSDTATGTVGPTVQAAASLDYAPGGGNPLPPNPTPDAAISGIWSGQLETPEAGYYNFVVEADGGATVKLVLGGVDRPLTQIGTVWRNAGPLELKAATLYDIAMTVEKVKSSLKIKWETPKRAREVISGRYLYPPSVLAPVSDVYIRFLKVVSLGDGLHLTANDLAHFATDADYLVNAQGQLDIGGQGWLNALPNADNLDLANPAEAAIAQALNATLLAPLRALLDYARLKAALAPGDESLLRVLLDPVAATAKPDSALFTLAHWDRASVNSLLAHFGRGTTDLSHLEQFRRVYEAFGLIQTMGIPASALIKATTNEPDSGVVRDVQAALRARYDASAWRDVVRPINDALRDLQRDALVAYILHQMRLDPASAHIDTPDKLFEYFLMDVQMEPCMQTSRIRHALSSVQLFIERCLMNLEPGVTLSTSQAKQWEWMKRYRIWEANRKVFLWPENWLEPELRGDKSPFFKEIESELLQSDITEDTAATALLNYLSKLEEVAKLEPCGIYHDETDANQHIDHVIARTAGAHRKYYYRRREGLAWTPWEQIKLDIEDNPVVPVVWKDRLLLFWLRILKQAPLTVQKPGTVDHRMGEHHSLGRSTSAAGPKLIDLTTGDIPTAVPRVTVQAVLCWSEYYNGKWQPTKTSDVNGPAVLGDFAAAGPGVFPRSDVRLSVDEVEDGLRLTVSGAGIASFLLYNTHSLPVGTNKPEQKPHYGTWRMLGKSSNPFTISYHSWTPDLPPVNLPREVLTDPLTRGIVEPLHPLDTPWDAPFFYEDSRHVFFVTTEEQQVMIWDYPHYGLAGGLGSYQAAKAPQLVLQADPYKQARPNFAGDGGPVSPDLGVADPARMQRFVTEDAYIRQGIGSTGSVAYGTRQIGPAGAIPTALDKTR